MTAPRYHPHDASPLLLRLNQMLLTFAHPNYFFGQASCCRRLGIASTLAKERRARKQFLQGGPRMSPCQDSINHTQHCLVSVRIVLSSLFTLVAAGI